METGVTASGSAEGSTANISSSTTQTVPKATSADDLLEMYEAEDAKTEATKSSETKNLTVNDAIKASEKPAFDSDSSLEDKEKSGEAKPEVEDKTPKLKAKHGDVELDIPEDAVLEAEVDGKKVPFKVKDALRAVAAQAEFNRAADRRLSYIATREQKFVGEFTKAQDTFKNIADLAAQGDHLAGLRLLAEFAGKDPVAYERETLENLDRAAQTLKQMTPEQRESFYAKRKAEFLENKLNTVEKERAFSLEVQQLQQKVLHLSKENGIDVKEFYEYAADLKESGVFKDPNDITPEHVLQYHQDVAHIRKVDEAIRGAAPGMVNNEQFQDYIFKLTRQEGWSTEDIKDVVRRAIRPNEQLVENLKPKSPAQANSNDSASSVDELDDFFIKPRR